MTRIATLVIACLCLALVPTVVDAAPRPALSTLGTTIGNVVTGSNHHTVYVFDLDHRGTHRSACTGACLRAWRPVTFAGTAHTRIRAAGISAAVRSIPASHHRRQITLGGWPLYYYVGDAAPGETNGRGSGGVWWPVSPDGSRIKVIPVDPHPLPSGTPAGTSYTLSTRGTSLGAVVTTVGGMTVYRLDNDTPNDSTSACTGVCSYAWFPVTASGTATGSPDITGAVAETADSQVTLDGYRLYTYVGDSNPGDVNGEAVVSWSAVHPDGSKVKG